MQFKDLDNNNLKTTLAYINTKTNTLFGKDVHINLNNKSFSKNNEPRLKGNSVINNDKTAEITKGVFTTCKKREGCPPWQMSAEKITHSKQKKMIFYKNAWLKVYDTPVFYFPKFFHPDPTVKRQSGFLMPTIMSSSGLGTSLNTPYYHVLANNKDFTLNPRFYSKNNVNLIKLVNFLIKDQKLTIQGVKKILNKKINNLDQYRSSSIKAEYYKKLIISKSKNLLNKLNKLKK